MKCRIRDMDVYYELAGDGRPIVMLHGWSLDHHQMVSRLEPVFEGSAGWKRIYLDLPGHGKTPAKPWVRNMEDMLSVVLEVTEALIPGERFALAGASAGAYLARAVAHDRAESVDGLLLMVPMVTSDDSKRRLPERKILVEDPQLAASLGPGETFGLAVVQSRKILDYARNTIAPARQRADSDFLERIGNAPELYALPFEASPARPLPAPTLIVTGRQDHVCGYLDAWDLLESYPRATFAVLDRAGHMLPIEQEGLLRTLVAEWLDRVQEYASTQR